MRITLTQILLMVVFASLVSAGGLKGQEILDREISLNVHDKKVKHVLNEIEKQLSVIFTYRPDLVEVSKKISVNVNDTSLREVLDRLFLGSVGFIASGDEILLTPVSPPAPPETHELTPLPPDFAVSGVVTDENSQPVPGVNVLEKGTTSGTVTDSEGKYSLVLLDGNATLVFSFIGFERQEVAVNARQVIDITLVPEILSLQEVVVVGYGTQKKSDVTGSIVRVTTEKTENIPNYNILQSLQGRVPGLNVTSPDRPGENPALSIRGINSISASTSPLIVVDGIIYNGNLSDFNANDIATVDILKDASAAAVYGSRAANGVLLITTKTGSTEKPQFNFNTYHGIQTPDRLIRVLDGPGYIQKVLDFREAKGLEADPANIENYLTVIEAENYRNGVVTDWMDEVMRLGVTSNYHLNVSGKSSRTDYYFSGTYYKQDGIVKNDDYQRMTVNLNLTNHITDWYSVSIKSIFSTQDFSGREANFNGASQQSPYGNLYDENGPGGYALLPVGDAIGVNPMLSTLIQNKDVGTSLRGIFSSNMEVPFVTGLKWTLNASSNLRNAKVSEFIDNKSSNAGIVANGVGTKTITEFFDWTVDNIVNYTKSINDVHSLDLTFLYSREHSRLEYSGLTGRDFFTQVTGYNNLSLAQLQQVESNYEDQYSTAIMGRVNYGYKDRYAITLTTRRDGFSGFARNNKFAVFPSVALGWTATNEAFLADVPWLDYLKLRLSYGKNGNQAVGRYQSLAKMSSSQYLFGQTPITTIYASSMANSDLSWETTTTKNAGIDFQILKSVLTGSIDVYSSNTTDLLLQRALPQTSGFNTIFTNIGNVHNHGVEVALNSINVNNERTKITWEKGVVFALNRNKIVSLTGEDANGDGREDDDILNGWFIGESLNSIYNYKVDGVYQTGETIPSGFAPGNFRLVDTNGDGSLTPDDRVLLGNTLPNYSFSISNTLRYKNFSLYMLINSIQGGNNSYLGNNTATRSVSTGSATFTERNNFQDVPYWRPNRPSNEYSRIDAYPSLPTIVLEDRSFIRLQDVSLAYSFNRGVLGAGSSLRLYASAKNLYTYTNWTGYDPENATVIRGGFPLMKSYTIGLDLKF